MVAYADGAENALRLCREVDGRVLTFHSVTIDKVYKDGDEWKHSTSFAVEDLPKIRLLAGEVCKHLRVQQSEPQQESGEEEPDAS